MKNSFIFDENYYRSGSYDDYLECFISDGVKIASQIETDIGKNKFKNILDVGCGPGGLVKAFREMDYKAYGCDISDYAMEISPVKKWLKKSSVENLPYKNNEFDLVVSLDMLYYVDWKYINVVIEELARVTRKYLVVDLILKGSVYADQKINPDYLRNNNNLKTKEEWIEVFENHGFNPAMSIYDNNNYPDLNTIFIKN